MSIRDNWYFLMPENRCRYKGGKGGKVKPPKPASPSPIPKEIDERQRQKQIADARQRIRALGRQGTILTEGQELGKSTILGRSNG